MRAMHQRVATGEAKSNAAPTPVTSPKRNRQLQRQHPPPIRCEITSDASDLSDRSEISGYASSAGGYRHFAHHRFQSLAEYRERETLLDVTARHGAHLD